MLMRNIQEDLLPAVHRYQRNDFGDSLPPKKHSLTWHSKEHLENCTALSQLKVVYDNQKMQMNGRDTGGKIHSKEKSNQQIRNIFKLCNPPVRGKRGPCFGVWLQHLCSQKGFAGNLARSSFSGRCLGALFLSQAGNVILYAMIFLVCLFLMGHTTQTSHGEGREGWRSNGNTPQPCPHSSKSFRAILQSASTRGSVIAASPQRARASWAPLCPSAYAPVQTATSGRAPATALSHCCSCHVYQLGVFVFCHKGDSIP